MCGFERVKYSDKKPDAYPLIKITDTLDSLGQCKVFTVLYVVI